MEPPDPALTLALYEAVEASPKPAIIVCQEIGGFRDFASHSGEVMATLLLNFGAIGLVTDCGVRDINEVPALGFHYFARGMVASHAYCRIASVGRTVQILGMPIRPGDLLHGDGNGLLQIPGDHAEEVPGLVERVRKEERAMMDEIRAGGYTIEKLRQHLTGDRPA